jgi:predicted nucleic acid-binding protein
MNTVFVDTAPLIYLVEGSPAMRQAVRSRLSGWIEQNALLRSSVLTLAELLVPAKRAGDARLVYQFKTVLRELFGAPLCGIDEHQAERAAEIRAQYGFSAPDALQLASAQALNCDAFFTNDRQLRKFKEMEVVLVTDRKVA